jgi:hypothetical protein
MKRLLWTIATIAIVAGSALAQQPGAYCEAGSDAVVRFAVTRRNPAIVPDDSLVYNNCSPGDTIRLFHSSLPHPQRRIEACHLHRDEPTSIWLPPAQP